VTSVMERRAFLSAGLALLAAPLAAAAQQADLLHRIGFLHVADGSFPCLPTSARSSRRCSAVAQAERSTD